MKQNSDWLRSLIKEAKPHAKDKTRKALKDLMGKGYNKVTWIAGDDACDKCQDAATDIVDEEIEDFISGLAHDAPMAEHSHPDDKSCYLRVHSDNNSDLPAMKVFYNGSILEDK
jgi:hypothetical protein